MDIDKVISIIRTLKEQPTMSVGSGAIAGTQEAGDDPPVRKKKKYIYGGHGSRKMWLQDVKKNAISKSVSNKLHSKGLRIPKDKT